MANEKRLIDANALVPYLWALFKFFGSLPCSETDKATQRGIKRCIGEIKKMPTVDAVEVVRCKDCKWAEYGKDYEPYCNHWKSGLYANIKDADFCSYGERKDHGTV